MVTVTRISRTVDVLSLTERGPVRDSASPTPEWPGRDAGIRAWRLARGMIGLWESWGLVGLVAQSIRNGSWIVRNRVEAADGSCVDATTNW